MNCQTHFWIGLKPINNNKFIDINENLEKYIEQKKKLYKIQSKDVFVEENE